MIEPDRILEGLAATLERTVLPQLEGGFARGQLFAALEVLAALQGQVSWGGVLLDHEGALLRTLFEEAAPHAGATEVGMRIAAWLESPEAPVVDRVARGRRIVCDLIEGGHADAGSPVAQAVDAYLSSSALARAMALRPSRLAEISHG